MAQKYLPKIKIGTAKGVAKNLLSTKSGKQVSDTKFKQLLKAEGGLKKFAYSSSQSSLAKHQAKQFFGKVIGSAKEQRGLKINALAAKKLGIKISEAGQVSDIGLNKIYQKAGTEELASQQKVSSEPSPEEQRRQQRHEAALKTFHKRERADETRQEQKQQPTKEQAQHKPLTAPISHAGIGRAAGAGADQPGAVADRVSTGTSSPSTAEDERLSLLILPLQNLTPTVEGLAWVAKKFNGLISRTLASLRLFKITEAATAGKTPAKTVDISDMAAVTVAAKRAWATLCVFGTIKKTGRLLEITVEMVNTNSSQRLLLAQVKEETDDVFNLERKIGWQIANALQAEETTDDTAASSSPQKAEDLPI